MSQHKVEVIKTRLEEHPDADLLSIVKVKGWYCVVRTEDFKDIVDEDGYVMGAYIPIDSVLPPTPEWEYMQSKKYRVKTMRLRGILSQGILVPAKPEWEEGQDVMEELGIKKWIPPEEREVRFGGDSIPEPAGFNHHTDIENIQNFPGVFDETHDVVVTEKIHGTNARFGIVNGKFYIGSHNHTKLHPGNSVWSKAAEIFFIEKKLSEASMVLPGDLVIYGEIYGKFGKSYIQKLGYGMEKLGLVIFDIQTDGSFFDWEGVEDFAKTFGFDLPPVLYRGKFSEKAVEELAEGPTVLGKGIHLREGVVVRTVKEIFHRGIGRMWLKRKSNEYLLKMGKRR